jgi:tetratricopeptide (TPR) repeat protein
MRQALCVTKLSFYVLALMLAGLLVGNAQGQLNLGVEKPPPVVPPSGNVVRVRRAQRLEVERSPGMTDFDAWKQFFQTRPTNPETLRAMAADVRETCRQLKYEKKYDEMIAMINAALACGYPQPWMYEALAIGLELKGAPREEIERALMSAVDFSTTLEDLMFVGAYLANNGYDERALQLFRSVSSTNPARPEPYVQGLALAKRLDDEEAIRWATLGVLEQAWPREYLHIEEEARLLASATLAKLRDQGRREEFNEYLAAVNEARIRDCVVKVTWTGDADIDILVEEPSGTVCSLHLPKTTSGGVLVGDSYSQPDALGVSGTTELYLCAKGFNGHYRMLLRRIWGEVTAGKVTVDLYTNYRGKNQTHRHEQITLSENGALIEWDLQDGRRQQSLSDEQLLQTTRNHLAVSRAVIAQQLSLYENSQATKDYERSKKEAARDGRLTVRSRTRPGYRPVITTLPQGSNMTATAVISADRRYVRVTPTPLFSVIGPVSTFNFSSGTTGTSGTGTMTMTMTMTMTGTGT